MARRPHLLGIAMFVALGLAGCGGDKSEPGPAPAGETAKQAPAPSGPTVTVTGTVRVTGTVPPRKPIKMSAADPQCSKQHPEPVLSEDIVADAEGHLQNVFVYVKTGLEGKAFPTPATSVLLDQKGCVYIPHVMGVMVNQNIEIQNSDPTLHNVHAMPKKGEFNVGMPRQNSTITRKFAQEEVMVHIKCDVHPWMSAWVGVLPHPCFGVSDAAGNWTISGLPPGNYTIEAWHEKLGTRSQPLTVEAGQSPQLEFTFESTGS